MLSINQPWVSARFWKHESTKDNAPLEILYNCIINSIKGTLDLALSFSSTTDYSFDSELRYFHREHRKLPLPVVQLLTRIFSLIAKSYH